MEQVQIADQTGELLGKTRVPRQFWPRDLPNANHAEPRLHHASGGGGGDSTKVAPAAASDSSSSEVRAGHRHKQLRIAVIHPHLRIGNVSLSLLAIAHFLSARSDGRDLPLAIARIGLESSRLKLLCV